MGNADPQALLAVSQRLLCAGIFLRAAQLLLNWHDLADTRLLGWDADGRARKGLAWRMRVLLCHPGGGILLGLQAILACVGLFARSDIGGAAWLPAALCVLQAWFNYRFAMVYLASDTMTLIGLGAVFAAALDAGEPRLAGAALSFLGLQALLAYFMSGLTKVTAPAWRDGSHLIEILRCSAFRMAPCGQWLSRHRPLAKWAARSVIVLELLFPLSVALPSPAFAAFLVAGALFHGAIAFLMGLPGFFWSFVAAYPGICFLHDRLAAAI